MGTKSDIRWFQNFLQIDSDIEVLELSDLYPNKGTDRYYRSYAEVERKESKQQMQINSNSRVGRKGILEKDKKPFLIDQDLKPIKSEKRPFAKELFEKYYSISEKEKMATQAAQQRMEKAIGKTTPKKQIKAPAPPIKAKYPIMDWKNLPYASKLDGDQMNEILLGLEEGMTDEQVKSYFKLPADQMKQYRREQLEKE